MAAARAGTMTSQAARVEPSNQPREEKDGENSLIVDIHVY